VIDRVLREASLVTIALAIAVGYALMHLAQALGETVTLLLSSSPFGGRLAPVSPLTWTLGSRVLQLGPVVAGAIELAAVLLVAAVVLPRARRA
jgi:hypothetical protein